MVCNFGINIGMSLSDQPLISYFACVSKNNNEIDVWLLKWLHCWNGDRVFKDCFFSGPWVRWNVLTARSVGYPGETAQAAVEFLKCHFHCVKHDKQNPFHLCCIRVAAEKPRRLRSQNPRVKQPLGGRRVVCQNLDLAKLILLSKM